MADPVFPTLSNFGLVHVVDGKVTFSYRDSYGIGHTVTKPVLTADRIVQMVRLRAERFDASGELNRESNSSRTDRKYIAAQPNQILRQAWAKANDEERREMAMMLSQDSHNGTSSASWLARSKDKTAQRVEGDDGRPL